MKSKVESGLDRVQGCPLEYEYHVFFVLIRFNTVKLQITSKMLEICIL